jgi:hypothetical protein
MSPEQLLMMLFAASNADPSTSRARGVNIGQDLMGSLFDPQMAALTAALLGGDLGGGGGGERVAAAPEPIPFEPMTPMLDRYLGQEGSSGEVARMVAEGMPEVEIKLALRELHGNDPDTYKMFESLVDDLYKEQTSELTRRREYDMRVAEKQAAAAEKAPELSPMQKMLSDAGLPTSNRYSADSFKPGSLGGPSESSYDGFDRSRQSMNRAFGRQVADDELAGLLEKLAAYSPQTMPSLGQQGLGAMGPIGVSGPPQVAPSTGPQIPVGQSGPTGIPAPTGVTPQQGIAGTEGGVAGPTGKQAGGYFHDPTGLVNRTASGKLDFRKKHALEQFAREADRLAGWDDRARSINANMMNSRGRSPIADELARRALAMRAIGLN